MATKLECCRICGGETTLYEVLDLGEIYPSDFVRSQKGLTKAPLRLVQCSNCGLVQLADTVELNSMYKEKYWYRSSLNKSMLRDLKDVVEKTEARINLEPGDIVVDIGCNDGSMFEFYSTEGLVKIGFDPAPNLAGEAKSHCTHFVNDYFPNPAVDMATGSVAVVTSIAMYYDLPDPVSFALEVKRLLRPDGVWTIQFTDLYSMFKALAFDNICHEHLEYYSLNVLNNMLNSCGLQIFDLEYNKVNGGSLRVYVDQRSREPSPAVQEALQAEEEYFWSHDFYEFLSRMAAENKMTTDFLMDCKANGKKVFLLGASTKGNTLLQIFDITKDLIPVAAEVNSDKFGLRTVGTDIEIVSEETAMRLKPDYFFVPIWHFIDNLLEKDWAKKYMDEGGAFIVPLPEFKVYRKATQDIGQKTIGFLIDELITTDMKCWYAQEDIMNMDMPEKERLEASYRAQKMNARRNQLVRKIDELLGQGSISQTEKTYG